MKWRSRLESRSGFFQGTQASKKQTIIMASNSYEAYDSAEHFAVWTDSMIEIQRGLSIKMKEWNTLREMDSAGLVPNTLGLSDRLRQKRKEKEEQFLEPYADLLYEHIRRSVDIAALKAQMMASDKMEAVLYRYKTVFWDHRTPLDWQGRWRCRNLIRDNKWETEISVFKPTSEWKAYPDEEDDHDFSLYPVSLNRIVKGTDLLLRLNTLFGSQFGVRLLGQADNNAATDAEPFFARNMEICVRFYGKACPMRLPKLLATFEKYKTHTPHKLLAEEIVHVE